MSRVFEIQDTPSVAHYARALTALGNRVTVEHCSLFRVHDQVPGRTATAKQLVTWAGIAGGWRIVNSRYGKLGHAVCDHLGLEPQFRPDNAHWSA